MNQVSTLMRDQIESPMDRAIYWIEYVIRHRGAPHLRSASRRLSLHQRGFIDVIMALVLSSYLIAYVTIRLCRLCVFRTNGMQVTGYGKKHD